MALTGWQQPPPPSGGFGLFGQQAPGTHGPRYKPPRQPHRRSPHVRIPKPPTAPTRRPVNDPFAPLTNAQLQEQARAQAQAAWGPLAESIRQGIEARSRSGMAAIAGLTNQLGGLWAGVAPAEGQIYGQARAEQGRVNSELANRLGNFGQGLQGELQGKLAQQDAPANVVQQVAGGAGQTAQGVANANYAVGSAGLEALLAQGAAAQAYGAKLPGIAGLSGLHAGRQLEAQLNQSLADQLSKASADTASTQSQIFMHLLDQELNKAVARKSGLTKDAALAESKRYHTATLSYKMKNDARNRALKRRSLGISDRKLQETMRHNGETEAQATARLVQQAQKNRATARQNKVKNAQAHTRNAIAQQNANTSRYRAKHSGTKGKKGSVPKGLGGGH